MGASAKSIRELFVERNITPAFVLDEGGDIMDGFFPETTVPGDCMVGIRREGGGESGVYGQESGRSRLGAKRQQPAAAALSGHGAGEKKHPFPIRTGPALDALVDTMGRYCSFRTRLLLANRQWLRPLYHRWLIKKGA